MPHILRISNKVYFPITGLNFNQKIPFIGYFLVFFEGNVNEILLGRDLCSNHIFIPQVGEVSVWKVIIETLFRLDLTAL